MSNFINKTDAILKKNFLLKLLILVILVTIIFITMFPISKNVNKETDKEIVKKVNDIVFSNTTKFGGAISAEHGIGQLRKNDLKKYKSKFELEQMISIKKIFDPLVFLTQEKCFNLGNLHKPYLHFHRFLNVKMETLLVLRCRKKTI